MPRKTKRRKNGQGTVRLRKDGRWEGRHLVGYDENGKPKTKSVLAKSKEECIEKLKKLQEECGAVKSDKVTPRMKFGDWIDYWYTHFIKTNVRVTTQHHYEGNIYHHIIPEIGAIPLNKLTQNDLQQFYTRLKTSGRMVHQELYGNGLSDAAVRKCHANCRSALQRAVEDGLIPKNPAIGCKLPPKKAREMQVLTHEEMQRFLMQAREEGFYEMFLLELSTGLRRGELVALQWDDFNERTGELHICRQAISVGGALEITQPKTKSSIRTIILPPVVVRVLKAYHQEIHSVWMFPRNGDDSKPIHPSSIFACMKRILERAQCKSVRFHDLRHTFATEALEYGMDIKTLSTVIGHISSATTLNIYSHVTDAMQQAAAVKIDKGIAGMDAPQQTDEPETTGKTIFLPYKGKRRRAGTGCISHISSNVWEGRYSPMWPDGKMHSRSIYAHSREEAERLLPDLIAEMKEEIRLARESAAAGALDSSLIPDGISAKEKAVREYMLAHPGETNKSKIARECGVSRETAAKYYEIWQQDTIMNLNIEKKGDSNESLHTSQQTGTDRQ